jgi:hypothetical protein
LKHQRWTGWHWHLCGLRQQLCLGSLSLPPLLPTIFLDDDNDDDDDNNNNNSNNHDHDDDDNDDIESS